jgi:polysaccharide export outer membrane protein
MTNIKLSRVCFVYELTLASAILLAASVPLCAQVQPAATSADVFRQAPALRIAAGDLIDVVVFDTPELSGKLRVDENGEITLPVGGVMQVAHLTAEDAAAQLETRLHDSLIMNRPHVLIMVEDYSSQGVTVAGEVQRPGTYPLVGAKTLADMISGAGGLTEASTALVLIAHREAPEQPQRVRYDSTNPAQSSGVLIQPGDSITVQRSGVVYVVGAVQHAGGFLLETSRDHLTVLEALTLAQGPSPLAALKKALLVRTTAYGRDAIALNLKQLLSNQAPDIPMQEGDILYVPINGWKAAGLTPLQIIATATGMAAGAAVIAH